ncbi:unnamed protein product [Rotaria sordida]|uniref:DOMON domain-containing protein n=1 Tax=Rotaria sordida TaxID=392033 RepID=A0A815IMV6_9BILA|nr:unnamed protein product [Rotaria sordida]CAF1370468.1 unnamed protein product [Rotaria sordida]
MKTLGWIALGLSPGGGVGGADIDVGWISDGKTHFKIRIEKEEYSWTAVQFKRKLDTCDPIVVAIKFDTNTLIYAYGLKDPNPNISYHETRKGNHILWLLGYKNARLLVIELEAGTIVSTVRIESEAAFIDQRWVADFIRINPLVEYSIINFYYKKNGRGQPIEIVLDALTALIVVDEAIKKKLKKEILHSRMNLRK